MSKYDSIRVWKQKQARKMHACDVCGTTIEPGVTYVAEELNGGVRKPPQLRLGKRCMNCHSGAAANT